MSLTITETVMTSTSTRHTATLVDSERGVWTVSWLGDEALLDRNQAITAMTLAEAIGEGATPVEPIWRGVVEWSHELGLSTAWAVKRIRGSAVPS